MTATGFDDVLLVNPSGLRPATAAEVSAAEAELGTRLPAGYATFVERLGEGELGHFVWVARPSTLSAQTREWRERVQQFWFWDTTDAGVAPEALQQRGVLVASTLDGDELCFDPADPDTLFVLPRNEDVAHRVGPGFVAALEWLLSGRLNPYVEGWVFVAGTDRARTQESVPGGDVDALARAVSSRSEVSHVVRADDGISLFLPAIEGRLFLSAWDGEVTAQLSHGDAADGDAVRAVLAALRS